MGLTDELSRFRDELRDGWARAAARELWRRTPRLVGLALAIVLLFGFCAGAALAQDTSGPRVALLWWTAPTLMDDGSAIAGALSYRVYRGPKGAPKSFVAQTSALTIRLERQPLGEQCYALTAVLGTLESMRTNEVCKTMRLDPPTDGSIERPTDGSIEQQR